MNEIILHIGLPKTGTTVLQNSVFSKINFYAGKRMNDQKSSFSQTIQSMLEKDTSTNIANNINDACEKQEINRILISNEAFSQIFLKNNIAHKCIDPLNIPKVEKWAIIPVVEKLFDIASVKILLTVRNQPEWMASNYSQFSNTLMRPSQEDFERRIKEHINNQCRCLDLSKIADRIIHIIGNENICVLPLEEMTYISYWEKLEDFLNLELTTESEIGNIPVLNKRRASDFSWSLRAFDPPGLRLHSKFFFQSLGFSKPPKIIRKFIGATDRLFNPLASSLMNMRRDSNIVLSRELRNSIIRHYNSSNEAFLRRFEIENVSDDYL